MSDKYIQLDAKEVERQIARLFTDFHDELADDDGLRADVAASLVGRFWSKVDIMPINRVETPCWNWTAAIGPKGYGLFSFGQVTKRAHRVSYLLNVGDIPEGLHVLHTCDNPRCVRPSHLFLGTNHDNVLDRERKGRSYRPVWTKRKERRKVTPEMIAEMKASASRGESQKETAQRLGINPRTIWKTLKCEA